MTFGGVQPVYSDEEKEFLRLQYIGALGLFGISEVFRKPYQGLTASDYEVWRSVKADSAACNAVNGLNELVVDANRSNYEV